MKKAFLFLIPVFFLVACGKKQRVSSCVNEENTIVVSVPKPIYDKPASANIMEYVDSVKLIWLETTEDNLIASINELLFSDKYIIISDRKTGSILFFDYDGNYSHKIHRRGRGPGEYIGLGYVMLDQKNDWIFVYDAESRNMLCYDFSGNPISEIKNFCDGMLARDIIILPDGDFLCYRQDRLASELEYQAGLWKVKADGSFDRFLYPFDFNYKSNFVQYIYHLSYLPNGEISFVDQNQTAIFHVKDDVVYKRVQFEMPGKTQADFPGDSRSKEDGCYSVFLNQEKGDFVFTYWADDQHNIFMTIFTKSTEKLDVGFFTPSKEFIPGGEFVRNNDPYICTSWFLPIGVDMYLRGDLPEEMKPKINAFAGMSPKQLEESNPILQLLYIKK